MILWPKPPLPPQVERNLNVLRSSGAAIELEDDRRRFVFENYAWGDEWPLRFILCDERGRRVTVVIDETGDWLIAPTIEAPVQREQEAPQAA